MQKIVLDSNVFFSALYSNQGASFQIVSRLFEAKNVNQFINCVSVPTILELEDILLRPKNRQLLEHLTNEDISAFIDNVVFVSEQVKLNYLWRPFLKDSGDDKVLEVAFNSSSNSIVTHNLKDFIGVDEAFNIKVISPKQFLQTLKEK